jgi:AcrR family transcriptional regulator
LRSHQPFRAALAPDPYAALLPGEPRARAALRRATILAAARAEIARAEGGFTLRRVAEASGVSVQTLGNAFGRREDLMVAAFNDHTSAVWRALDRFSSGPFLFLDLALMYHRCALASPEFLRAMVTSAMARTQPLAVVQRHGSVIKTAHLAKLARSGALRPGVDPQALAAHITRLNTFMMYEWAQGGAADALRAAMIDGNRLLLMGAMTPAAAAQVEAWEPALAA